MNLELLPNEILLDLFTYFNGIDLLDIFYGLNSRINILLYNQFRFYCFKFSFISKRKFDMICHQHLPFIADHIISLRLSDAHDTPEQINLLFSYIPSFRQFTYLRSLSVTGIYLYKTLLKLVDECQHLCNLTHLHFKIHSFSNHESECQLIIDNIWSLPKLNYFKFDIDNERKEIACTPTKISPTLKCVNIQGYKLKWNQINQLFECTPCIKRLSLNIITTDNDDYISFALPTLVDLHIGIFCKIEISTMICFLSNTPNLCRLNIRLLSNLITGYHWEQIIRDYLPKLQVFRLNMKDRLPSRLDIEKPVDQLIDSFRSSFWIDERKWFVRCFPTDESIHLYTLSEASHYGDEKPNEFWRTTHPFDNQQNFYRNITNIYDDEFFEQQFPSNIRLPNITNLSIKFPINKQFWSLVPNLNRLKSLEISKYNDIFQSQLQTLLDRAPRLCALEVTQDESFLPLQMSLFKYINASVRELNLQNHGHHFNDEECIALSRSSLGVQCEVLSIQVTSRENIIILVQNMTTLRTLHVKCKNEKESECTSLIVIDDEIIQWLKDRSPSTCLIRKDPNSLNCIQIWI